MSIVIRDFWTRSSSISQNPVSEAFCAFENRVLCSNFGKQPRVMSGISIESVVKYFDQQLGNLTKRFLGF